MTIKELKSLFINFQKTNKMKEDLKIKKKQEVESAIGHLNTLNDRTSFVLLSVDCEQGRTRVQSFVYATKKEDESVTVLETVNELRTLADKIESDYTRKLSERWGKDFISDLENFLKRK